MKVKVNHPEWGDSPVTKKDDLSIPAGSQSSSRLVDVGHENDRRKTKFGISKGNSASTRNESIMKCARGTYFACV